MSEGEWRVFKEQAELVFESRFFPPSIKSLSQILYIGMKGYELGLPLCQSLSGISVINGKPVIGAELMLSLIYTHSPKSQIHFEEITDRGCTIVATRAGGKPHTFSFNEADARAAGLLGKGPWKMYKKAMFKARAISLMARSLFSDCLMGASYTPEELGSPELDNLPSQPEYLKEQVPLPHSPIPSSNTPEIQEWEQITSPVPIAIVKEESKKPFNNEDEKQIGMLHTLLRKKGVDRDDYDPIAKAMHGKFSADLDNVMSKYYSSVLEVNESDKTTKEG
tara:strand:+ start:11626 stop:12462 length:837 start_codon:yes stop_codon:yes gene_type:complete